MRAYLIATLVLWALMFIGWVLTKPGAPRKPNTHGQILFGALTACALMAWALNLLFGGVAP